MAQIDRQEYKAAKSTFNEGLKHCPGDSHLVAGIEKANKYIAVVESIHVAGGEPEFDLDAPASRRDRDDEGTTAPTSAEVNSTKTPTTKQRTAETTGADDTIPELNPVSSDDPPTQSEQSPSTSKPQPDSESAAQAKKAKEKDDEPWPGTAEAEIERVKNAPNHYAVLHVSTDATSAEMKKNYYTLARMLHPDRCQLDGAGDAMTSISQAYDTLSNVLKKTLYDQFLSQTGGDNDEPNQTYQEWESRQEPVKIPKWLSFLLGIRGCGYIIVFLFIILLLPIILLFAVIYLVFTILCLPVSCFFRAFFPEKYAAMKEREEREMAKAEEEAQDRMFAHV